MSSLHKLLDCDRTPRVTLDKGELGMDRVLDDGEIPVEQRMLRRSGGRGRNDPRPRGGDSVKPAAREVLM